MGLGGIGIWQLVIILLIVLMLFGSKRIGALGSDLGSAIRGFRNGMGEDAEAHPGVNNPGAEKQPSTGV